MIHFLTALACESRSSLYFVKHFKNNIMEREIGEQFYIDNEKYEIVKGNSEKCLLCCFNNISCLNVKKYVGVCSANFRKDHKNIYVKRVKE